MPPNDAESLARPNGNATGFLAFDYSISAKWLELLKEISPNVVRVGVLRNPAISAAIGQFAVIQATAPSLGVEVSALNIHRHSEIPGVIAGFARGTNDGLIVTASVFAVRGRDLIIADAAKRRLATATTDVTNTGSSAAARTCWVAPPKIIWRKRLCV